MDCVHALIIKLFGYEINEPTNEPSDRMDHSNAHKSINGCRSELEVSLTLYTLVLSWCCPRWA